MLDFIPYKFAIIYTTLLFARRKLDWNDFIYFQKQPNQFFVQGFFLFLCFIVAVTV